MTVIFEHPEDGELARDIRSYQSLLMPLKIEEELEFAKATISVLAILFDDAGRHSQAEELWKIWDKFEILIDRWRKIDEEGQRK